MYDLINACISITSHVAEELRTTIDDIRKHSKQASVDTGEFFYCLGGAFAKLIDQLGNETQQPGAPDSFMEGFSSYRRFLREVRNDSVIPPRLSWLVDKDSSLN